MKVLFFSLNFENVGLPPDYFCELRRWCACELFRLSCKNNYKSCIYILPSRFVVRSLQNSKTKANLNIIIILLNEVFYRSGLEVSILFWNIFGMLKHMVSLFRYKKSPIHRKKFRIQQKFIESLYIYTSAWKRWNFL